LNISLVDSVIKVVVPFEFEGKFEKFKNLFKNNFNIKHHLCNGNEQCNNKSYFCPEDRKDYFLSYMNDYLYTDINGSNESFHLHLMNQIRRMIEMA